VKESRMSRQEIGEEAAWLHDNGLHPERVVKALNRSGGAIAKALAQVGRHDLTRHYHNLNKAGTRIGDDDDE